MKKIPTHKNKSLKDLKGEQWREIPYTEGYYVVSNLGRVKALERIVYYRTAPNGRRLKERIVSQAVSKIKNRYVGDYTYGPAVKLFVDGVILNVRVGRLVYEMFVLPKTGKRMDGLLVFPLDGNGLNCRADNLGLCTRSELRIRGLKNNRYLPPVELLPKAFFVKNAIAAGRGRRKKVNKYTPDGRLVASYLSITTAAKKNKISIGCVALCAQKKIKSLKGFIYRYADEGYAGELASQIGKEKKIIQYSPGGKKLAEYKSINEAARLLNIFATEISGTAKKRTMQAGGFVWRFAGDRYRGEYKDQLRKRKFAQYSTDGRKLGVYDSISFAASQTDGTYENIRRALQKQTKSSNGYIWEWLS